MASSKVLLCVSVLLSGAYCASAVSTLAINNALLWTHREIITYTLVADSNFDSFLAKTSGSTFFAPTSDAWRELEQSPPHPFFDGFRVSLNPVVKSGITGNNTLDTIICNLLAYHVVPHYANFATLSQLQTGELQATTYPTELRGQSLSPFRNVETADGLIVRPDILKDGRLSIQGINRVFIPADLSSLLQPSEICAFTKESKGTMVFKLLQAIRRMVPFQAGSFLRLEQ